MLGKLLMKIDTKTKEIKKVRRFVTLLSTIKPTLKKMMRHFPQVSIFEQN